MTEIVLKARQLPKGDYLGLKAVTRELADRVGSDAHASRATRVTPVQIGRYGNARDEEFVETFMPIDVVADLEAEVGPIVTRELARLCGHLLVELPHGMREIVDLGRVSGRAMKEVGDVFTGMGAALDDGILASSEGPQLLRDIDEALTMLATLRLMVLNATKGDRDD